MDRCLLVAKALAGDVAAAWLPESVTRSRRVEARAGRRSWRCLFVTLLVVSLVAMLVVQLVRKAGLGLEDRLLGGSFGFRAGIADRVLRGRACSRGLTALPRQPRRGATRC